LAAQGSLAPLADPIHRPQHLSRSRVLSAVAIGLM
jgi:hypothetical protein